MINSKSTPAEPSPARPTTADQTRPVNNVGSSSPSHVPHLVRSVVDARLEKYGVSPWNREEQDKFYAPVTPSSPANLATEMERVSINTFTTASPATSSSTNNLRGVASSSIISSSSSSQSFMEDWSLDYLTADMVVIEPDLTSALRRMGGEATAKRFRDSWESLDEVGLSADRLEAVLSAVNMESGKAGVGSGALVEGKYWMEALADGAKSPSSRSWIWRAGSQTPPAPTVNNPNTRKPDAFLAHHLAAKNAHRWQNMAVSVEFTTADCPRLSANISTTKPAFATKLLQLVTNMAALLTSEQCTRNSITGLAFFGADQKADLVLVVLDHEQLTLCPIRGCFGPNLRTTILLLDFLRSAEDVYSLGFSPLFEYSLDTAQHESYLTQLLANSAEPGVSTIARLEPPFAGDIVPISLLLPAQSYINPKHPSSAKSPLLLVGPPFNLLSPSPFSRSTLIFRVVVETAPGVLESFVLKLQWIVAESAGWESSVLKHLWSDPPPPSASSSPPSERKNFPGDSPPTYAPVLVASFNANPMSFQVPSPTSSLVLCTRRHQEVLLLQTPIDARPLSELASASLLLFVACQLIDALEHAWEQKVLHRDISSGNVLATPDGQLVLIDFDCAAISDGRASGAAQLVQMGTMDTMAVEVLLSMMYATPFQHRLEHDLELSCLLLIKVLMQAVSGDKWKSTLKACYWDVAKEPGVMLQSHFGVWSTSVILEEGGFADIISGGMRRLGVDEWAGLVEEISKLGVVGFGRKGKWTGEAVSKLRGVLASAILEPH